MAKMEYYEKLGKLETFFHLKEADPFFLLQWCMDHKLIASESICPVCNDTMVLAPCKNLQDKANWSCHVLLNNELHHVKRSIREGSWFHESDLSIPQILLLTFMWVAKLPIAFITEQLEISQSIVEDWGTFCRTLCFKDLTMSSQRLGGKDTIIEVEKKQLREFKYKNGKLLEGKWVIWGFQRGTCNCFYSIVKEVNQESVFSVLQKYVLPETTVVSHCWNACGGTELLNFFSEEANHKLKFEDIGADKSRNDESLIFGYKIFLRSLDRIWGVTDNSLVNNTQHQKVGFDFYLAEYVWRKKYKTNAERMERLLAAVTVLYPTRQVVAEDQIPEEIKIKMEFDILDEISEGMAIKVEPDAENEMPEEMVLKMESDTEGIEIQLENQKTEGTETCVEEQMPDVISTKMEFDTDDGMSQGIITNVIEPYKRNQMLKKKVIKIKHDPGGTETQLEKQMLEGTKTQLEKPITKGTETQLKK